MLLSALMFSSAGLFTKGISAGSWEIIFWRGLFASLVTFLYLALRRSLHREFVRMGRWGLIAALVGASGSAAFIPAFKLTTIANVALIYASAPLIAALIAWAWISEKMTWPAIAGCTAAVIGVIVIVQGSFEGVNLIGDMLALWMTLVMAFVIVIYRRFPDTPSAGPAVLNSLVLLPFAAWFGEPLAIPFWEVGITACFGIVFAIAAVALTEGAKRLPAGEAGLLSSSEAPFAIALAFIILSEVPATASLVGGCMILFGVLGSQIDMMKEQTHGNS